jgi:hypothetical protein
MRVIALIDDPRVVRRILEHLGRWVPQPAERGPPAQAPEWPPNAVIPLPRSSRHHTTRSPHASQDSRHLDVTGIEIGRAQAQHTLSAMLGSAESAPNRRHRSDARKEQD